jgi:hypothetical protein
MANEVISVLLPTRQRPEMLERSIRSLLDNAENPERVELLVAVDQGDNQTVVQLQGGMSEYLREKNVDCRANVFKPIGFSQLHAYYNTLANNSHGKWLMLWQDDCIMKTQGWDTVVDEYTGQFKLLAVEVNSELTPNYPYATTPIIPNDWFVLMEHLSPHPQVDSWLSHVAYMLDVYTPVNIEVHHDNPDFTGREPDDTYLRRVIHEGDPSNPSDFGHTNMQEARVNTAKRVAWFLNAIGQPSIWWQNVELGAQDPFEKMPKDYTPPVPQKVHQVNLDDQETIVL